MWFTLFPLPHRSHTYRYPLRLQQTANMVTKILFVVIGVVLRSIDATVTNVSLTGPAPGMGTVGVLKDGEWGTICQDGFNQIDAKVVCTMAYGSKSDIALPVMAGTFPRGSGKIHFDELSCNGGETSLEDCPTSSFKDCFHFEDAGVICDSSQIQMRLVNGSSNNEGRLEINIGGVWGTVCDDEFESRAAKLACKALNLPSAYSYVGDFGSGSGTIFMDDVMCQGQEQSIFDCNMTAIGDNDCDHSEDVGIICTDKEPNLQVRLIGGTTTNEGRVEVSLNNGPWGTVCDDLWDNDDAKVVCTMLNMYNGSAKAVGNAYFGFGTGNILMDDVTCSGNENSLVACNFGGYGQHDCDHSEDAGVMCHADTANGIDSVRLVGGSSPKEGRVEVHHGSHWGTVCDDQFDDREAKVICNMLGYTNGTSIAVSEAQFGSGVGPIFMDELRCSGSESNLDKCRFDGYGVHDCDHTEDAGVICDATKQSLSVRLVDGKNPYEGRLEVFYHNQWGTVCDDSFNTQSAKVACSMLGFSSTNAESVHNAFFGSGSGPIWLDNVNCRGTENSIDQCRHNPFSVNNCDHDEDVGVRCGGAAETPIRLAGGAGPFEGRVEVFHEGQWGSVCDDQFTAEDAMVICNAVGYPTNNPVFKTAVPGFGSTTGPIWLDNLRCVGNETSVDACLHNRWGDNNCDHSEDISVICRSHGIKCYHCDGLTDPRTCGETIQCAAGEACEEVSYIFNGETRFSLTCQSKLVCDAIGDSSIIGKRESSSRRQSGGQTTRVRCCTTALCNKDLIDTPSGSHSTGGSGSATCEDKQGMDCQALDGINICGSRTTAKLLCPKHCGLCP